MELTLLLIRVIKYNNGGGWVLILVLLELTLLPTFVGVPNPLVSCFNPCFIGTYSITKRYMDGCTSIICVLILVLLELTLLLIEATICENGVRMF